MAAPTRANQGDIQIERPSLPQQTRYGAPGLVQCGCEPSVSSVGSERHLTEPSPSYVRPPVGEVALGIYFSPPVTLRSVDTGLLWEKWRGRYPKAVDQPALPPVVPESFPASPQAVSIHFAGGLSGSRVWFLSDTEDRLIQVQPDRLVLNWRKTADDQSYPRYDNLRPIFAQEAAEFLSFLKETGDTSPTIAQAEVTYVNPVPIAALGERRDLARLVAPWSGRFSDSFLPPPEDANLGLRFLIPDPDSNEPIGRLHIDGHSARRQNPGGSAAEEVFVIQLFARGKPVGTGLDGALAFLDLGHDWVVRGFTSLTTSPMHELWEREA